MAGVKGGMEAEVPARCAPCRRARGHVRELCDQWRFASPALHIHQVRHGRRRRDAGISNLQLALERVLHALELLLAAHQLAKQTLFFDEAAAKSQQYERTNPLADASDTHLPSMLLSSPCSLCLITTSSSSAIASGAGVSLLAPIIPPMAPDDAPLLEAEPRSRSCCSRAWMRCVYLRQKASRIKTEKRKWNCENYPCTTSLYF